MERNERTPGEQVGGYEILATLGSGAAGTVYRAQDGAGQLVALKLLHPVYAASQDARVRLMREVAALQKVSHPAIARVLDAEVEDTEPFLVTELIDGPSLEDEVMGGGPLLPTELYELGQQLADAITAVHHVGLIHRDIKPSNILVTRSGPVLIDFGIAQEVADARVTSHGFVMGTPGYLAPQMLDGHSPDQSTDWWGWAGSLVFAATGRAPFGVRPLDIVLSRVRSGTADLAGLGPITQAALEGALNAEPESRLTPDVVLAELRRAADTGEQNMPPTPVVSPTAGTQDVPLRTAVVGAPVMGSAGGAATADGYGSAETAQFEAPAQRPANPDGLSGSGATAVMPVVMQPDTQAHQHHPGDGREPDQSWYGEDEVLQDSDEDEGYMRPPVRKRALSLLALSVPPILAAGLYPGLTAIVVLTVLVVLRTVGVTSQALHSRREVRGVRRSDGVRHTLLFPWYVIRAFFGLIPAILVAASSAVIVLGALWWTLQTNKWVPATMTAGGDGDQIAVSGTQNASWVFVLALCFTAAIALFVLWFGPLSRTTREGARVTLNKIAPGKGGALGVVLVVLALSAVLVLWLLIEMTTVWWPFTGPPDLS